MKTRPYTDIAMTVAILRGFHVLHSHGLRALSVLAHQNSQFSKLTQSSWINGKYLKPGVENPQDISKDTRRHTPVEDIGICDFSALIRYLTIGSLVGAPAVIDAYINNRGDQFVNWMAYAIGSILSGVSFFYSFAYFIQPSPSHARCHFALSKFNSEDIESLKVILNRASREDRSIELAVKTKTPEKGVLGQLNMAGNINETDFQQRLFTRIEIIKLRRILVDNQQIRLADKLSDGNFACCLPLVGSLLTLIAITANFLACLKIEVWMDFENDSLNEEALELRELRTGIAIALSNVLGTFLWEKGMRMFQHTIMDRPHRKHVQQLNQAPVSRPTLGSKCCTFFKICLGCEPDEPKHVQQGGYQTVFENPASGNHQQMRAEKERHNSPQPNVPLLKVQS